MNTLTRDIKKATGICSAVDFKSDAAKVQQVCNLATVHLIGETPNVEIANLGNQTLIAQGMPALSRQLVSYMLARVSGLKYSPKEAAFSVDDGTECSETAAADWHNKLITWNTWKTPAPTAEKPCKFLQDATRLKDKALKAKVFESDAHKADSVQFARDLEDLIAKHRRIIADYVPAKPKRSKKAATPAQPENVTELKVA